MMENSVVESFSSSFPLIYLLDVGICSKQCSISFLFVAENVAIAGISLHVNEMLGQRGKNS